MYECKICGKQIPTFRGLGGHQRLHSPEKYRKTFEQCTDDRTRKRCLLEERGCRCEVCGNSEWMGQTIPIEIDHIDGNPENKDKSNYRLICPNCHAQTPTYRGRNVGRIKNSKRAETFKKYSGRYR